MAKYVYTHYIDILTLVCHTHSYTPSIHTLYAVININPIMLYIYYIHIICCNINPVMLYIYYIHIIAVININAVMLYIMLSHLLICVNYHTHFIFYLHCIFGHLYMICKSTYLRYLKIDFH